MTRDYIGGAGGQAPEPAWSAHGGQAPGAGHRGPGVGRREPASLACWGGRRARGTGSLHRLSVCMCVLPGAGLGVVTREVCRVPAI